MSDSSENEILGMDSQQLLRWGLILLLSVIAFGSIQQNGALSGTYQLSSVLIFVPIVIMMYLVVIYTMYAVGLNPNKFELFFIPTLLVGMIFVSMYFVDGIPQPGQNGGGDSIASDTPIDRSEIPRSTSGNGSSISNTLNSFITPTGPSKFDMLLQNVLSAITIIVVLLGLIGLLYWYVSRKNYDPEIQFRKVNEYAKSPFESNQSIIDYYVDASNKIEGIKGKAPEWFSPTYFSLQVDDSPGPPLSSYFDQLTEIYEEARFGEKEMSHEDVLEAKDLHDQVSMQIERMYEAIRAQERKQ